MICTKKRDRRTKKRDKLLKLLFEAKEPLTVRQLAAKSKMAKSTVQRTISELKKNGVLNEDSSPSNSTYARFIKSYFYINKLYESGLVDYLIAEQRPSAIILFGSFAKGEYVKESDIDIFVESTKKAPGVQKFEKKLEHEIQLFVKADINELPDELLNNIINGKKLYGYFNVK